MPYFSFAGCRQILHTVSPGKMNLEITFALYRRKKANQESLRSLINIRHKLKYRKEFCTLAADPLK